MYKDVYLKADVELMETTLMETKKQTPYDLMLKAATGCFKTIKDLGLVSINRDVLVCAGVGRNGGDALLLAHLLIPHVKSLKIYLTSVKKPHDPTYSKALDLLLKSNLNILFITPKTLDQFNTDLHACDLLIDGIFGTGFKDKENAWIESVFDLINNAHKPVVSIDLPSGLTCDSGQSYHAIKATYTCAIGVYKMGHFIFDGLDVCGEIHLVDIGLIKPDLDVSRILIDATYFKEMTPKRRHNTHKYHYGNLLVVGGSIGLMGAPLLSAHAAYKMGCGLSSILYAEKTYPHRFQLIPEIMTYSFNEKSSSDQILQKKSAVSFGMGLDQSPIYTKLLKDILDKKMPILIDAGGLFHLKQILQKEFNHPVVITPHAKELADLLSTTPNEIYSDLIKTIETFAKNHGIVLCLKGPTTLITDGKQTYLCPFGHPGLAKAGSGDVLSGIIGALLAQGKQAIEATLFGVYVLGSAADKALDFHGEISMMATDVIHHIKDVLKPS